MCGICGITYFDHERPVERGLLDRMCKVITHRGPDEGGSLAVRNFGVGMRRLSIIDLASGQQPISNEDGSVWIVFNGEIYNHLEVRRELEARGHRFRTHCDTEVIVHAYEEYGEACPNKLNGMFGFAILDQRKRSIFLARDRLGIKPLYYYTDSEKFVFGSELKSILQAPDICKELDTRALDMFLTFEYIPAPYSIFKNIAKLPAGHTLTYRDGRISVKPFWELAFSESERDEAEICEELLELLRDAVKIRLMSEVPLGAFLSGGIDSSSIVALMSEAMNRPVKTFSIGFKESSYNESEYARIVAERYQTEHHESTIEMDALSLTQKLLGHLDEPFGDFSIFPTYLVSKMAREHVTVALSGDGGDELFGGYDTYLANRAAAVYSKIPGFLRRHVIETALNRIPPTDKKKGLVNRAKRFVEGMQLPGDLEHTRWMIFLQEAEKGELYTHELASTLRQVDCFDFIRSAFRAAGTADELNRQLYVDIKSYLADDILVKVDRMSMAASLEARVPLLDYRVVELAASIPGALKIQSSQTKYIFKKATQSLLPREILNRGKEGFSIPIKNWLRQDLKELMLETLSEKRIREQGFFAPSAVRRLINEHLEGIDNHSHRLWALMVFGIWQDLYLGENSNAYEEAIQTSDEFATV